VKLEGESKGGRERREGGKTTENKEKFLSPNAHVNSQYLGGSTMNEDSYFLRTQWSCQRCRIRTHSPKMYIFFGSFCQLVPIIHPIHANRKKALGTVKTAPRL